VPLEQLLSFDATPAWISGNWARVTTRLAEIDLQGWRVPLATGTSPKDLVGSVTYYFDSLEQLQRISLYGYTGDAEKILTMATQRYQMQTYPSVNGDLYLGFVEGQPLGMLHVRPAPVVRSAAPGSRYQILMEINRTGSPYGLSSECQRILRRTGFPTPVQPTATVGK
jgi:hypothetical protein